jgi:hypothetical protein
LENTFSLERGEIKRIISKWVEETYKLRGVTPTGSKRDKLLRVEETYKLRGVTPPVVIANDEGRWKLLTI